MTEVEKIYQRRFEKDIDFRIKMYKVLCEDFFSRYIPENSVILDLAAGYCEFINNIRAKKKIAVDINPDLKKYAHQDVETILAKSTHMSKISDNSIDVVFVSNFFEHISRDDIVKTVSEIHRILKPEGKLLILQPNFRYCYKDYWMFSDHITAIDDRSLTETLETNGFQVKEIKPKFLPYTVKSKLPKSILLLKIYINMPILQFIFGKQAFIYAQKESAS